MLTCVNVLPAQAVSPMVLRLRIDELSLSARTKRALQNAKLTFVWELVEKTWPEIDSGGLLTSRSKGEIIKYLERFDLKLGTPITRELKMALGFKLHGREPREFSPPFDSLSLEELDADIKKLTWLRDNYDAVKAGLKAFEHL